MSSLLSARNAASTVFSVVGAGEVAAGVGRDVADP
jgi:hypothetical protein